ncbi:MAG: IS5 family transposase [Pseudomonadota bacterium]
MVWNPFTRAQHDRSRLRYASDLTDAEWRLLEPLMQPQSPLGRRRRTNMRDVMAGIFYVLQSGCAWHLIPKDFPPKSTVYRYFQYFIQEGLWDQIMGILHARLREQEGCDAQPTYAIIDSQSAKTGPNASKYIGFDAGKKVKGRKRYIVVDTLGFILKADVHSASIQDRNGAASVFERLTHSFPFLTAVCADGGYAGPIAQKNCPVELDIVKRNQKQFEVLPIRWIVECTFAWISINRRMAMDHERYASTTLAFMHIAMIKIFIRRLARS